MKKQNTNTPSVITGASEILGRASVRFQKPQKPCSLAPQTRGAAWPIAAVMISLILGTFQSVKAAVSMTIARNDLIWELAGHNAFTDLHGHGGTLYCVFRIAADHFSTNGKIQVTKYNPATDKWTGVGLPQIAYDPPTPRYPASYVADLRDPKLSTMPNGNIMLTVAATVYDTAFTPVRKIGTQSLSYFSNNMVDWGTPNILSEPGALAPTGGWYWRTEWSGSTAYNFRYVYGYGVSLMKSTNGGVSFPNQVGPTYYAGSTYNANETALCFTGTSLVALMRLDGSDSIAKLSTFTPPPYTSISWHSTNQRIGGPDLFRMSDGQIILGARRFSGGTSGNPYVAISRVFPSLHSISQDIAVLTSKSISGNDCGYPGIWKYGNQIWVSYYSSHGGSNKARIYLARLNYTL